MTIVGSLLRRATTLLHAQLGARVGAWFGARFSSPLGGRPRPHRAEAFGGIIQLTTPRALVFVDRALAQRHGIDGGAAWRDPAADGAIDHQPLAAPLEAHLQLTNQCAAGCQGCYTGASPQARADEWGLTEWSQAIDVLAEMGVFHVALGGGESAVLPWLGALAAHARRRGMVPNLTTSGLDGLANVLEHAELFGQINVSLDGLRDTYRAVRGFDGYERAVAAIRALRQVKREIGINVVVTRQNFSELDQIFAQARALRLSEVELLRFKPSGRGSAAYAALACTQAQHRLFLPTVLAAAKRHRVRVKVDCSYVPMLAYHQPSRELMAQLAVYGCTAGDFLVGAKAQGWMSACSFTPPGQAGPKRPVTELPQAWADDAAFAPFRQWRALGEPCRSCHYFSLCRGGCKVVSGHVARAWHTPDPECPRVVDSRAQAPARRHLPVV